MANRESYTVGWICAITTEYVAARCFLDETHDGPESLPPNDSNHYTLGRIKDHNVVITALPDGEYGISSATAILKDMLRSFPSIRIGLMVGIGGGAPSRKHDIRLGDVVVSAPRDGNGGVFQYDFGKTIQDQEFHATGYLSPPPVFLRTAITGLRTKYETDGHAIEEVIDSVLKKKKRLQSKYKRPDPSSDRLYKSNITHHSRGQQTRTVSSHYSRSASQPGDTFLSEEEEADCRNICGEEPSKLVLRRKRDETDDNPAIHYGLIASANTLMKDAIIRDKLAAEKGVLCFEMEAAGLMNQFPCLIIRGICDYSDSHKNKQWQGYAAMTAAAYAKDLLYEIAPTTIKAERKITEIPGILASIGRDINEIRANVQDTNDNVKDLRVESRRAEIDRWLSAPDPSTNYNKALNLRLAESGDWFLKHDVFNKWRTSQKSSLLWLYGIPGCGKTILSSTIIRSLSDCQPLLYFFFDFNDGNKQTLEGMLCSLISQLSYKCKDLRQLDNLFASCQDGHRKSTLQELRETFLKMVGQVKEIWLVLDALDECYNERSELLAWMKEIQESSEQINVHLLVTSRPEKDIESGVREFTHSNNSLPIKSNLITDDITAYIRSRVRGPKFKRWKSNSEVQSKIETTLCEKANGMFRWVACQLDALEGCLDRPSVLKTLKSLPKDLDGTYERILNNIPDGYKETSIKVLQLLTYSERPLRIKEAIDAIAVFPDQGDDQCFDPENRMPDPTEISLYCSSLVVTVPVEDGDDTSAELQLAHSSVKEYLTSSPPIELAQKFQELNAKALIAKICLSYLLHLDVNLSTEKLVEDFPLAEYCARYWITFAKVAECTDETVQGLIRKFFCGPKGTYKYCYTLHRLDRELFGEKGVWSGEDAVSPLYYASAGGLVNTVEDLIKYPGVDVNVQGGYFGNPLQAASANGHTNVVKLLLASGADPNAVGGFFNNPLQAAVIFGRLDIVILLLNNGAHLSSLTLEVGSGEGRNDVVHELLASGLDIGVITSQMASTEGYYNIAKRMLGTGVKASGDTLAVVCYFGPGFDKIAKLLIDYGVDVNWQDGKALKQAASRGHYSTARLLLENGASPTTSALQAASYCGHNNIVELLISHGADVNGGNGSALKAAKSRGHHSTVQLLLAKGAYPYDDTPQILSSQRSDNVVELLLPADSLD